MVYDTGVTMPNHNRFPGDRDILALGPTVGSARTFIRHRPDHSIETGLAQPLKDGVPIQGDSVLKLTSSGVPGYYEVEECYTLKASTEGPQVSEAPTEKLAKGPAKVNSDQYKAGWDRIFGTTTTVGQA